ncbi:MAG: tyrosine-type recombinase/integrase [Promethearchaeota archaeon]|jgi:site-specific recombinase XerD
MTLVLEEFVTTGISWKKPVAENSRKNYRNHLLQFERFLDNRGKNVTDGTVDEKDIADYIEHMQKQGFQPNTLAVKVAAVNSYFKWLEHKGSIVHRPKIKSMSHQTGQHQKIDDKVLEQVFEAVDTSGQSGARDVAMLSLIAFCGFKTEEVVALNISNIDLLNSRIKTAKGMHFIGYANSVVDRLTHYQDLRNELKPDPNPEDPFFLNKYGQRISGRSLRRHLQRYLAAANVHKFSTRDMQHTFKERQSLTV